MNRAIFSIVLLGLLAHLSTAEFLMKPKDFECLYRAAVDISMACYGDPGNAVGIIGDTDGSILKELRSKYFIPVVLVNGSNSGHWDRARSHELRVFIIAVSSSIHLHDLLSDLTHYIWWNKDANFLIVDTRPELKIQCARSDLYMIFATIFGMLNVQFICRYRRQRLESILIWNSNIFMHQAPEVWKFIEEYDLKTGGDNRNGYLFVRFYREGGQSCESINFAKTGDVGGYPLHFVSHMNSSVLKRGSDKYKNFLAQFEGSNKILMEWVIDDYLWFVDNIVIGMNVTAVMTDVVPSIDPAILLQPQAFSTHHKDHGGTEGIIVRLNQVPILALTQHTLHMSQLDKILSVIDRESRIGMWIVYLITFLFFKFFLGQAVTPAILNLVRLTCGSGLTTLPQNVAPTIYLTCLFMFVVTLQAIYTGNLATLLTTTVSHPNVQTKEHIPKLGYKIYHYKDHHVKLIADPILDGCVVEISYSERCIDYVLHDPLAVCVLDHANAIALATKYKLHLSKYPMLSDYMIHKTKLPNLLQGRIEEVLTILFEAGLYHWDQTLDKLRLEFVDDDEVKKNTERRVMIFEDLSFAFTILGVGLLVAIVCFIGEVVVCRIRLKYTEQRNRLRGRSAWGLTAKKCSWFPSLTCRFNLRRLFSNRR